MDWDKAVWGIGLVSVGRYIGIQRPTNGPIDWIAIPLWLSGMGLLLWALASSKKDDSSSSEKKESKEL